MQCKIENISSIIISTFLKFLISFNLINLLQERVISEIFMFLWFVARIWEMPEYFVPVTKFMMTTVELAKCDKNIQ
jgi:hypothetical protein